MNGLQLALVSMAVTNQLGPRDAEGRPRPYTAAELDALADGGWHMPDVRGFVKACLTTLRVRGHVVSRLCSRGAHLTTAESR